MVHDGVDVGWEDRPVLVVDMHRRVGPPEERLRLGGPVRQANPDFEKGAIGVEREAMPAAGAEHPLQLGAPDRGGSVVVRLDCPVERLEGARPVMLWPVELDSAADPWTGQAD